MCRLIVNDALGLYSLCILISLYKKLTGLRRVKAALWRPLGAGRCTEAICEKQTCPPSWVFLVQMQSSSTAQSETEGRGTGGVISCWSGKTKQKMIFDEATGSWLMDLSSSWRRVLNPAVACRELHSCPTFCWCPLCTCIHTYFSCSL